MICANNINLKFEHDTQTKDTSHLINNRRTARTADAHSICLALRRLLAYQNSFGALEFSHYTHVVINTSTTYGSVKKTCASSSHQNSDVPPPTGPHTASKTCLSDEFTPNPYTAATSARSAE